MQFVSGVFLFVVFKGSIYVPSVGTSRLGQRCNVSVRKRLTVGGLGKRTQNVVGGAS